MKAFQTICGNKSVLRRPGWLRKCLGPVLRFPVQHSLLSLYTPFRIVHAIAEHQVVTRAS